MSYYKDLIGFAVFMTVLTAMLIALAYGPMDNLIQIDTGIVSEAINSGVFNET